MAAFDIALNKLRPSFAAAAIRTMRNAGISIYIHGSPGIAKSAVARQIADQLDIAFIDLRLSQLAPEDVRGVPMLGKLYGVEGVLWSPPLIFPRDLDYEQTERVEGGKTIRFFNPVGNNGIHYCTAPVITVVAEPPYTAKIIGQLADRFTVIVYKDEPGYAATANVTWTVSGPAQAIFALEEFNSAPPSVMAACYQLVHDRRVGDYRVPDGVMLIAMGNRDGDKGVTFKIPKPVANRFIHLEMVVNFEDWLEWAVLHHIHPDVVGYLSRWQTKLLEFDADSPLLSFPTPRTWEFVSTIISQQPVPRREVLVALVCGAIGNAVGTEFMTHCAFMADMPDALSILDGTTTTFRVSNRQYVTQIAYSTAVQMLYHLQEKNELIKQTYPNKLLGDRSSERKLWRQQADRAIGYMVDFFAPEVTIMALHMAMATYKLRFGSEMPRYTEFNRQNKDLFF